MNGVARWAGRACLAIGLVDLAAIDLLVGPRALSRDLHVAVSRPPTTTAPPIAIASSAPISDPPAGAALAFDGQSIASFDPGRVDAEDHAAIIALAHAMTDDPQHDVVLEGHADWIGTKEVNQRIAIERARWAKEQLIALGVPASRIAMRSAAQRHGAGARSDAATAAAQERRVDAIVVQRGEPWTR